MSPDVFIGYWPAWVALVVSALIAFNRLIDESRKFAAVFGEWGRKRHEKAINRHQIDLHASQFATAIQTAIAEARVAWEGEENEAIIALDKRLGVVAKVTSDQRGELAEVRDMLQAREEYADYELAWHKELRSLAAASPDGEIPVDTIPGHMNWWAFERLYRRLGPNGGQTWWFDVNRDILPARKPEEL